MPLRFSLREHDYSATHTPEFVFLKQSATILRVARTAGWGDGYAFIVVPRAWLNGKYLRFSWRSDVFWTFIAAVLIYDGEYTRSSDVDFPGNLPLLLKGNGLLQTVVTRSSAFGWTTDDVQANVGGGSEDYCTIFFKLRVNQNYAGTVYLDIDWFEINDSAGGVPTLYSESFTDSVTMEKTGSWGDYGYISTGVAVPYEVLALGASFEVGQDSANLSAGFVSGQGSVELAAEFVVIAADSVDLAAIFAARRDGTMNLPAAINITHPMDLPAKFRVEKIYDLRGTAGLAFYWWGADNPPSALVQLILETPTGFWYSDFYDGPARLRHVFIPWGSFTWVSAEQRYLEPHRHGFNEPDKSKIDGILYTIHTTGVRRIDYIYAPLMAEFSAKFIVRKSASRNLNAGFIVRHSDLKELPGEFVIIHTATPMILPAGFLIRQDVLDLPAGFHINAGIADLLAKIGVVSLETEDFEDAVLVDHYQHNTGNGFRDAVWAHTGTYSWRTRANQSDIFDISNGDVLTYAKIVLWSRYGNGGSNYLRFLDSGLNVLKTVFFASTSSWTQRIIEVTGAVKYLEIHCAAGGNSGVWTDDVEIRWTT